MTEKEQFELGIKRASVLLRANWHCEVCGNPLTDDTVQLAHRIPQRKHLLKRYGKEIIHHSLNLAATCSENCNAAVSLGENELQHKEVIEEIRKLQEEEMWWEDIL